eukprot:jgi/Mesvir1/24528/Mv21868-RA.1
MDPPAQYLCPISHDIMRDPVLLVESGQTYERVSIEQWFARGNETDPLTNVRVTNKTLAPVLSLRSLIEQWVERQSEQQRLGIADMDSSIPHIAQDRLVLGEVLHGGAMAVVYAAVLKPAGQEVAVKMFHARGLTDVESAKFRKEVQILHQASVFSHNVCRLIGVASINGQLSMVMPRYKASLEQVLLQRQDSAQAAVHGAPGAPRGLPLDRIMSISQDIALAIVDLHERGIMVLDLKPANILLDKYDRAVVADFGISALRLNTLSRYMPTAGSQGTPNYMAPEQWVPLEFGGVTTAADAWGFGCILVEMASGATPWAGMSMFQVMACVTQPRKMSPTISPGLPSPLTALLRKCFSYQPSDRPTFAEILAVLRQGAASKNLPPPVEPPVQGVPPQAATLAMLRDVNPAGVNPAGVDPVNPADDEDEERLGEFRWPVENFSRLSVKKIYSPAFIVGGHPWRILLFPRGNDRASLGIYIEVEDAPRQPFGWARFGEISLTLVNQVDPNLSITKETSHTFTNKETDWGFEEFVPLTELQRGGFIDHDTIVITASIRARKSRPVYYDSKKETGFVGLKNQGSTSYINALLQTLHHIPYFRRAVYQMPTAGEASPRTSVALALQCLFYRLQYQDHSVATKDLTKSFGWDRYESSMQHDVHELNRILCENLEEKMKHTVAEGTIQRLFEGHVYSYISCVDVDYTSYLTEPFYDLQLDVRGCRDVYASLDKYVAQEMLEGDNKYRAEHHGLQVAMKGALFKDLPPVLQLQLKRFEYDAQQDVMVKINDRYDFPQQLDLDKHDRMYLTWDADPSVRNLYELHSVLVHSGSVTSGRYYAVIRPGLGDQWYKFDDEHVTKMSASSALAGHYGGENLGNGNAKDSSAYMLVYVRKSDKERLMCPVTEADVPRHLQDRVLWETQEKERRRKQRAEAHLHTVMRVATDEDIRNQIGATRYFDLVEHAEVKEFRVKKEMLFGQFKEPVARELGVPSSQQRYWTWAKRQNHTYRPTACLISDENGTVSALERSGLARQANPTKANIINVFLETPPPPRAGVPVGLHEKGPDDILLFFKLYDPVQEKLRYVGHSIVRSSCRVPDVCPLMRQLAGYAPDEPIHVYEEVKWEPEVMCERLDEQQTLKECQLETGDILCFQKVVSANLASSCRFPEVPAYFNYVLNKQDVRFRQLKHFEEDDFVLELSKKHTYDEVVEKVVWQLQKMVTEGKKDGAELNTLAGGFLEPSKVRLTAHNCFQNVPKPLPIRYHGVDTLMGMLVHHNQTSDILYYEVLDIPLPEMERLKTLNLSLHNERTEEVAVLSVRLPKDSTLSDMLAVVKSKPECVNMGELRMIETFNSRIYKTFPLTESIANMDDTYWGLRVEEIPEEERRMGPRDKIISVSHFQKNPPNSSVVTTFGHPFMLAIGEHEKLSSVKHRVQAKLGVPDEEFAAWKFAIIVLGKPEYLWDDDVVAPHFQNEAGAWDHCLGLEHV